MAVYNAFGCCIGYILHHSGEITGCDEKFGCIKRNLPLRSAVLMNQLNEMFEYLFLAIHSFRLLLEEQMPGLVIEIQDKVLHEVLEYLKTEIVIAVIIQSFMAKLSLIKGLTRSSGMTMHGCSFKNWKKEGSRREVISLNRVSEKTI